MHLRGVPLILHFPCILAKTELSGTPGGHGRHCSPLRGGREGWKRRVLQNDSPLADVFDFQGWERGRGGVGGIIVSIL